MTKAEVEPFLGKFVHIACSYEVHRRGKPTQFLDAYGFIIKIEDGYVEFKDNENNKYLISLKKIWALTLEGRRRTVREYQEILKKEQGKTEKKTTKREIGRL